MNFCNMYQTLIEYMYFHMLPIFVDYVLENEQSCNKPDELFSVALYSQTQPIKANIAKKAIKSQKLLGKFYKYQHVNRNPIFTYKFILMFIGFSGINIGRSFQNFGVQL